MKLQGGVEMEPEHIIDEKVKLIGADIFRLYEACRSFFIKPWSIFSTITLDDKPFNLHIQYSHYMSGDIPLSIIVEMSFSQFKDSAEIRLRMRGLSEHSWQGTKPFVKVTKRLFKKLGVHPEDDVYSRLNRLR